MDESRKGDEEIASMAILETSGINKRERQTWGFARSGGRCNLAQCCQ